MLITNRSRQFKDSKYEQTVYSWRKLFGNMDGNEVKHLRQLETENARLKKLLAERTWVLGDSTGHGACGVRRTYKYRRSGPESMSPSHVPDHRCQVQQVMSESESQHGAH